MFVHESPVSRGPRLRGTSLRRGREPSASTLFGLPPASKGRGREGARASASPAHNTTQHNPAPFVWGSSSNGLVLPHVS
jgi:hypothetical protein